MPKPDHPIALNLARIIVYLMTHPRGWRVDQMMDDLGIKDRTYRKYRSLLHRYFDTLIYPGAGFQIREVQMEEGRFLRMIEEGPGEEEKLDFMGRMVSLYMARSIFSFLRETDLYSAVDHIFGEMLSGVKDRAFIRDHVFRNMDRMLYYIAEAPKDYSKHGKVIRDLLLALFYRRRIEIAYKSPYNEETNRILEPLTLILYKNGLYLVAQFPDSGARYTFAVDRIRNVTRKPERFQYPSDYSPEEFTDGCFGIFREKKPKPVKFEILFKDDKWLKAYLQERKWHPTQHFQNMKDGRLRMTFTVKSDKEVWPWVRSFGNDAEVAKPSPL